MNSNPSNGRFLNFDLAIFRLVNCCALIQEDMNGFYQTAGLEKIAQIDYIFNWLRKRSVSICLISDLSRSDTQIILQRLSWSPQSPASPVDAVILRKEIPPIQLYLKAAQVFGLNNCRTSIALADQPELLRGAWANGCLYTIGLNYGESTARNLSRVPNHTQLDSIIELPNFLSQELTYSLPKMPLDFRMPLSNSRLFS